jgi:hypothetical protein
MTYREHKSPPDYEQAIWEGDEVVNRDALKWSSKIPLPAVGDLIIVTMNGIGPAEVTGYFEESGWLGLLCTLLDPPDWHSKQNKTNTGGHIFGPEFRLPDLTGTPNEIDRAALKSYADEHGRGWKYDLRDDWMNARTPAGRFWADRGRLLHCLRNSQHFGPRGLNAFHLKKENA